MFSYQLVIICVLLQVALPASIRSGTRRPTHPRCELPERVRRCGKIGENSKPAQQATVVPQKRTRLMSEERKANKRRAVSSRADGSRLGVCWPRVSLVVYLFLVSIDLELNFTGTASVCKENRMCPCLLIFNVNVCACLRSRWRVCVCVCVCSLTTFVYVRACLRAPGHGGGAHRQLVCVSLCACACVSLCVCACQVTVAVLIDNFISATVEMEADKAAAEAAVLKRKEQVSPLLPRPSAPCLRRRPRDGCVFGGSGTAVVVGAALGRP